MAARRDSKRERGSNALFFLFLFNCAVCLFQRILELKKNESNQVACFV